MLANFLRLQIICTINCRAADIDHALLRPGLLMCHRVFERLNRIEAARLAASLGKNLPEARDYFLVEIFSGKQCDVLIRPRTGFATANYDRLQSAQSKCLISLPNRVIPKTFQHH